MMVLQLFKMTYKNLNFECIKKEDIKYIRDILKRKKDLLSWDEEYAGWFLLDEPIEMYLFMEENTILNPKELMGDVENIIENEMRIEK